MESLNWVLCLQAECSSLEAETEAAPRELAAAARYVDYPELVVQKRDGETGKGELGVGEGHKNVGAGDTGDIGTCIALKWSSLVKQNCDPMQHTGSIIVGLLLLLLFSYLLLSLLWWAMD